MEYAGCGWMRQYSEHSSQAFQIQAHHIGDAADLGVVPNIITRHSLFMPIHT
uniref:Uncharacterized protein n=1 Tax=Candidatus Nitrotoga fabula TaxID=2182327 RepID=A0A2X0SJK8_9PROT|nr:protein of unknown function [Candidatus Nitrotoga fabula]